MRNNIFYSYVRKKKDYLKRVVEARGQGIWMGPPPRIILPDELIVGDIVFCGSTKIDKRSSLIQNLTDGPYVHCGIYVGNGKIAEISLSGAKKTDLDVFIERYSYLAIARLNDLEPSKQRAIRRYAEICRKNSVGYSWIGAILLPFTEYFYIKSQYRMQFGKKYKKIRSPKKLFDRNRMFCSEFIVQCYKACGYIEKDDPYSVSHKCSPTWLAEDNNFQLAGYICSAGLSGVDNTDPFISGCSYILK